MKFKAAFATDDGKTFMERHFGDALFYDIYEFEDDKALFVKRIENTVPEEEEVHADPRKYLLIKAAENAIANIKAHSVNC